VARGAIATLKTLYLFSLAIVASPSFATIPGTNGQVAYTARDYSGVQAVFVTGTGQITFPNSGRVDWYPEFSPDGSRVAFIRRTSGSGTAADHLLMSVGSDAKLLLQHISSDAFDEAAVITTAAWLPDGRLSFVVSDSLDPTDNGVWTMDVDGSGLTQIVEFQNGYSLAWSHYGLEVAYTRRVPISGESRLFVYETWSGMERELPLEWPGVQHQVYDLEWMPEGERIVFTMEYQPIEGGTNRYVLRRDIFMIDSNGSDLKRLTDSGPDQCANYPAFGQATYRFDSPKPSPDGDSIVVWRDTRLRSPTDTLCQFFSYEARGIYTFGLTGNGANPILLVADAGSPSWQTIPADLTVKVDDGHGNPLGGLKVELRTPGGQIVDAAPLNVFGGSYGFLDVAPGDYSVRATLVDNKFAPAAEPSFDIRHIQQPDEPVWIETNLTLAPASPDEKTLLPMSFEDSIDVAATSVSSDEKYRLDDMANIYFRLRQFVDWAKLNLNLVDGTGSTVEFYTFSPPDHPTRGVDPRGAYYSLAATEVVLGLRTSEYYDRDGVADADHDDDGPENGEWHEFTHHLFLNWVNNSCTSPYTNHGGYRNADTCDSMSEGFASFLPALAAQWIDGASDDWYDGFLSLELQSPWAKAWGTRPGRVMPLSTEDLAVPALLWDLVDTASDSEFTQAIGEDLQHHAVTYTDTTSVPLGTLWQQMVDAPAMATVYDLRRSFGDPAITIDLDGDTVPDIAPIDAVFLMHGFFPIEDDQSITPFHFSHHYDLAAANRNVPSAPRDTAVGQSNHRIIDASGTETGKLSPRYDTTIDDRSNVRIDVQDALGTPLSGAEIEFVVDYPGSTPDQRILRKLGSGDAALVNLQLPAYFDYLLPEGAALPACDPLTDVRVDVTIIATVNGYVSPDQPTFDNCTYVRAIDAATEPFALSFRETFPEDSTPPLTSVQTEAPGERAGRPPKDYWTVELVCADPVQAGFASGCQHIEYSIDHGPIGFYQKPLIVADDGAGHTVDYRSVDAAANEETFRTEFLPEPTGSAVLASGMVTLAGLYRLRRR
jgi:hypothetical protein